MQNLTQHCTCTHPVAAVSFRINQRQGFGRVRVSAEEKIVLSGTLLHRIKAKIGVATPLVYTENRRSF